MKRILVVLLATLFIAPAVKADEGMWLPLLIKRLNYADMKAKGLQLTAEEIYSVNNSSLKDAIVMLSGGSCTAEAISPNGLLLTNHHCAYGAVQAQSSTENNYLEEGFWAKSYDEELPNAGMTASFLVRMEDVTNQILSELTDDMTEAERDAKIAEVSKGIQEKAIEGTVYDARVKSFFNGNEFYLFVYTTYRDVRLAGIPPEAIGKFGGDTDNWMWPRHTGDFALLRVYGDAEGNPSDFSKENQPIQPKHFLPISIKGVKEGDYAMVMGYPGSTDRYLSSYGVQMELDYRQPTIVEIRDTKLNTMKKFMDQDKAVRIQYASKYASISNYWKYFIGQQKQLKQNNVYDKKVALENEFKAWLDKNPEKNAKYGEALKLMEEGINELSKTAIAGTYLIEAGITGANPILFAFRAQRMLEPVINDASMMESVKPKLEQLAEGNFKDFHGPLEKELYRQMLEMYIANVPADQLPDYIKEVVVGKYKGDVDKYISKTWDKSIYTSKARFEAFLKSPSQKVLDADEIGKASSNFLSLYFASNEMNKEANAKLDKGNRLFVAGLREMNPNKKYYPDANSTMRLTYGTVGSYEPADGVKYNYYTTLEGVMQKEDATNPEFIVPAKLSSLYGKKDFGRYANEKGELVTCFITNNDITGGNSGSPVINANGELIGCAFDGNWEAMSGDISFETEIQRTICVDARYILFVIDKMAGAQNIINELNIVERPAKTAIPQPMEEVEMGMAE
ncbi:S46 family peptidase [Luteibaculum oceani]|uniref:Dipeptidyl-peptidase n=1 Tax=Luteibaculum oceani TaxID=1294296 RepID=A0A5C6UY89_9FLAO|nr:S46 family peptidase [Luteibaculum oceani]TXC75605.1 S46 family peptidase [Luteibaculum oceani]